jgi:hypothetical protein
VLGRSRFYGVQRGPTSPGRTWLLDVTTVSVTPYTYTEDFTGNDAVLSRDKLKIAFRVHTVWRIDDRQVPLLMERFSTTAGRHDIEKDPRRRRQSRVRQLRARAVEDVRARRSAAAQRSRGQGRADSDRRGRPGADPCLCGRGTVHHQQRCRRRLYIPVGPMGVPLTGTFSATGR